MDTKKRPEIESPERRQFLGTVLSAGAGFLLAASTTESVLQAEPQGCPTSASCAAGTGQELTQPGELPSSGGFLRGVVAVEQDLRNVTYYNGVVNQQPNFVCRSHLLRAYHGYVDMTAYGQQKPVTLKGVASPGPTLRAKVGDNVELIFLNRIDNGCFPQTPLTGVGNGCEVTRVNGQPQYPSRPNPNFNSSKPENPSTNPKTFTDTFPDCFRVANTTNMHFHGTHTTPGGLGDNVLVGVLPNLGITPAAGAQACGEMFALCKPGDSDPLAWRDMPHDKARWDSFQKWFGTANQALAKLQPGAAQSNTKEFEAGEWPQYWPGYYPYYFPLPKYTKGGQYQAGQLPGTHWYHAHQHGSTSIQLLNGMAGAFIISSDDYDGKIHSLASGGKPIQEKVMVLQLFSELTNLMTGGSPQSLCVNGQLQPIVSMKPGEVQWWRMVNGSIQSHGISTFFFLEKAKYDALVAKFDAGGGKLPAQPIPTDRGTVPQFRQVARDGIQFAWANYVRHASDNEYKLSPANRIDFLMQAPTKPGDYMLVFWPAFRSAPPNGGPPQFQDLRGQLVLTVRVGGTLNGENTAWYDASLPAPPDNYPVFPEFMNDILPEECKIMRRVEFSMIRKNTQQPIFMIDGKQFNDGTIDKVMLEGDTEEWLLVNSSVNSVMHPFHIHINPFQVVEVFDPSTMEEPQKLANYFPWHDTIAIPAGFFKPVVPQPDPANPLDYKFVPGHIRIRHRFLDFPGKFVLHCHILGHEDRGMMQLIEVVSNKTIVQHH